MAERVYVDWHGAIRLPEESCGEAGITSGDCLMVEMIGTGELRLRTPERAIKIAQAIVAPYLTKGRDLVQELIDERRAEAARESEEIRRSLSSRGPRG